MQQCNKCKKLFPLTDFAFRERAKGTRQRHCRECQKAANAASYQRNKRRVMERKVLSRPKYVARNRRFVLDYLLRHPCPCGETDPLFLEFDHLRDKEFEVGALVTMASSIARIEREIAKCQVLCVKCHRRKTAADFAWNKKTVEPPAQPVLWDALAGGESQCSPKAYSWP